MWVLIVVMASNFAIMHDFSSQAACQKAMQSFNTMQVQSIACVQK
jgi:hypothetical protein